MQSPARARYSPLAIRAASCAVAGDAPIASHAARKAGSRAFKVLGIGAISPHSGGLRQPFGTGRLRRLEKEESAGAGRDERKAATALTSPSSEGRQRSACSPAPRRSG